MSLQEEEDNSGWARCLEDMLGLGPHRAGGLFLKLLVGCHDPFTRVAAFGLLSVCRESVHNMVVYVGNDSFCAF